MRYANEKCRHRMVRNLHEEAQLRILSRSLPLTSMQSYNSIAGIAPVDINSKLALRVVTYKSDIYSLFWAEICNSYSKLMHRTQTFLLTLVSNLSQVS